MTINAFDKTNLTSLRSDINAALKAVGDKYGISIQAGNATFTASVATFKLACMVGDTTISEMKKDKSALDLTICQPMYFPDLKLDARYAMGNDVFKIVGYNTRGRTQPMKIVSLKSGKEFKCSIAHLRNARVVV